MIIYKADFLEKICKKYKNSQNQNIYNSTNRYILFIKNKKMKDQVLGLIRHALTFVGGIVVAKGLVDDILFQEILGGVMTLVGAIWSVTSKNKVA